jgi:hypothetical protein
MNKQHAVQNLPQRLRMMKRHSSFFITLFFVFGCLSVFGQTETRTTITTMNASPSTEKSKLEYLKNENPELYVIYSKIINLDSEIRNFADKNQLPASVMEQFTLKASSICADCFKNGVIEPSTVYVHINNSSTPSSLLEFMEEFLTNLSNQ